MSEAQDGKPQAPARAVPQPRGKLTLLKSLVILVTIYAVGEISSQFVALKAPAAISWMELSQWVLIIL